MLSDAGEIFSQTVMIDVIKPRQGLHFAFSPVSFSSSLPTAAELRERERVLVVFDLLELLYQNAQYLHFAQRT